MLHLEIGSIAKAIIGRLPWSDPVIGRGGSTYFLSPLFHVLVNGTIAHKVQTPQVNGLQNLALSFLFNLISYYPLPHKACHDHSDTVIKTNSSYI